MLDLPILFVATADSTRSRDFYEQRLGMEFVSDEPYALVFRTGSSELRIQKVRELRSAEHTVLGWNVSDIAAAVSALIERGVTFERYGHLPQDRDGIWTAPDGARIAWFRDPDGNVLSLTQHT